MRGSGLPGAQLAADGHGGGDLGLGDVRLRAMRHDMCSVVGVDEGGELPKEDRSRDADLLPGATFAEHQNEAVAATRQPFDVLDAHDVLDAPQHRERFFVTHREGGTEGPFRPERIDGLGSDSSPSTSTYHGAPFGLVVVEPRLL